MVWEARVMPAEITSEKRSSGGSSCLSVSDPTTVIRVGRWKDEWKRGIRFLEIQTASSDHLSQVGPTLGGGSWKDYLSHYRNKS